MVTLLSLSYKENHIKKMEGITSPTNALLIAYDVTSMHTNIEFMKLLSLLMHEDNMWAKTIKLDIIYPTSKALTL